MSQGREHVVSDIIKTWPAATDGRTIVEIFRPRQPHWAVYYFTLGRGKPTQNIDRLWFTWRSRILGSTKVHRIVRNDGSLPKLSRLDGGESEWQIKRDAWVAICEEDFVPLRERLYMSGFRGWRYFDLQSYSQTAEAKVRW